MTDFCKVKLIGNMISDTIECTDWSKDNMDALLVCIQTVVEYDGGDYPPLPESLDFSYDHLPHSEMQKLENGEPVGDLSKGVGIEGGQLRS